MHCDEVLPLNSLVVFDVTIGGESVRVRGVVASQRLDGPPSHPNGHVVRFLGLSRMAEKQFARAVNQLPAFLERLQEWTEFDMDAFAWKDS
ncbi:MAG: hypothetical protein GWP91_07620 [Rhodobacterales bacterium]|nr:hypothetical protein [Rhodobacterales bacterium]